MLTEIKVGEKTLKLANNALTPILYRQIFKKDFLALFSSMITKNRSVIDKALKLQAVKADFDEEKITKEEFLKKYSEIGFNTDELDIVNERADLMSEIAFIMSKQAEIEKAEKLVQLTLLDYYDFLSKFDINDLRSAPVVNQLIAIWQGNTASGVKAKNI